MDKVVNYLRRNVVRVYGVAVAVLALLAVYFNLPSDAILGVVGAVLALVGGEAVQRVENAKTFRADVAAYSEGKADGRLGV